MVQFRAVRESVRNMRAAVASLASRVETEGGERAELAEWVARHRAARGASLPPPAPAPLVSSSAPASALAAWSELQRQRFGR